MYPLCGLIRLVSEVYTQITQANFDTVVCLGGSSSGQAVRNLICRIEVVKVYDDLTAKFKLPKLYNYRASIVAKATYPTRQSY